RRTSVQKARNIDTSGLKRELSFTSVSLNDVSRAIESEEPEIDWLEDFWHSVLVSAPAPELKWMAARPLSSWVTIYNRWQAMGNWKPGFAPQYLDAYKMQELLQIPLPKVLEYVKLFDPHQYQKLITTKSALDHSRVKVSVPAFLTSCIVMSTSISKKQKISFLLGCFDENDNLNLDVAQWSSMLSAFLTGVASFFSVDTEVLRKSACRQVLSKRLFAGLLRTGLRKLAYWDAQTRICNGSASFDMIEEWLLGETDDPLALPFALFLARFSGLEEPELFEEDER
ncbi:unnamed protein product, partial [Effrenium voratum]